MAYEYEGAIESILMNMVNREQHKSDIYYLMADEVEEVYAKAKKLNKIIELTDVPMNIKQDKTMIEINKILNEYTEDK